MNLYNQLKQASSFVKYPYKEDMIQDLWIRLIDRDIPNFRYLVVCCINYVKDSYKTKLTYVEQLPEIIDFQEINKFDDLYSKSEHKDLINNFLDAKDWLHYSKQIGCSDKTAKKQLTNLLRDEYNRQL